MNYRFSLLLILFSCVKLDTNLPSPQKYNVIAYLVNGNDTQLIFFDKTYKPTEQHGYGLEGANIVVYNNSNTYQFSYPKTIDTLNYYYSVFNPNPNDTYFLRITTPTGETLYSKTYIPSSFNIIQPIENETILVPSNKLIIWTRSEGAYCYKINAYKNLRDSTIIFELPYLSVDTFSDMFLYPYFFPDSGVYTISIISANSDVYNYWNKVISNVEGAEGIFGGVVLRKVKVFIRKP